MKMLLGGDWVDRARTIEVRDPYDGAAIDTVPAADGGDVETALAAAVEGARRARREVARSIHTLDLSADGARRLAGETIPFDSFPGGEHRKGWFERVPVGVVTAITPFNDPLNLVAHKLGPAIAAGNAAILKPASLTPLSALTLAQTLQEAGLPPLVVQVVTGRARDLGDALVADDRVRMVSFTAASRRAAPSPGGRGFWAAGPNCIGVQRVYVHRDRYAPFRDRFAARALRVGAKLDEATDMGPVIDEASAARIESWVREAVGRGARVLAGGHRRLTLVEPTVLEGVPPTARLHRDEAFGPTVNLYPVDDLDAAVAAANAVSFGLHAAILTRDSDLAFEAAAGLECGAVMIDDSTDYRLDAMPFGGVKDSGLGREGVPFAIAEMTEPKVVCWLGRKGRA